MNDLKFAKRYHYTTQQFFSKFVPGEKIRKIVIDCDAAVSTILLYFSVSHWIRISTIINVQVAMEVSIAWNSDVERR